MARLTVIIPTFNRPEYLARCLETVAAQTFRDFDLVVLDNASTEDNGPVLRRFRDLDIEYIRNLENLGATGNIEKAREIGARSPYHIVFHDDDLMHPRMLESQITILDAHPEIAWLATECQPFGPGEKPSFVDQYEHDVPTEIYGDATVLVRRLLENTPLHFGSVMFRTTLTETTNMRVDEFTIIADRVLLCDMALHAPAALITRPLVLYRHHEAQDSHNPVLRELHALALMAYYRRLLPEPLSASDHKLIKHHATNYLLHARSIVAPQDRIRMSELIRAAKTDDLFGWLSLDGQGVTALARLAGMGSAYEAVRPGLGSIKRLLRR
ncbi:MAG: glycosyltransferase family A protein [Actinomycetota bacterium]|nr:glycosyltransferase family A protein [Actinomycetota bacterium]